MIAFSNASLIVLLVGCLVLNCFALRSSARLVGQGRALMLRMAAIWAAIILALTLGLRLLGLGGASQP